MAVTDNNRNAADSRTVRAGRRRLRGIPPVDVAASHARRSLRRLVLLGLHAALREAAGDTGPRLLIVVLRGGMDGINTVVPFGDSNYISMRGSIAIPAASTIQLDSFFGLHPALKNFGNLYRTGQAAAVHATCVPLRNRSHFDAQDNLENGLPGRGSQTGWLNRLLTALPAGEPIKTAGAHPDR